MPRLSLPALCLFLTAGLPAQTGSTGIRVLAVTNAATFTSGLPGYGSLATVFCTGLTGIDGAVQAAQYPLPYLVAGVSVRIAGVDAPLLVVADLGSYQQINLQVPVVTQDAALVVVSQAQQSGQTMAPAPLSWGVFFTTPSDGESGAGAAICQHADYSLVTADHPARPGEIVTVYGINLATYGQTISNPPKLGFPSPTDPLAELSQGSLLGGYSAIWTELAVNAEESEIQFIGLAPGLVGVFQVNFRIPSDTPDGDATLNAVVKALGSTGLGIFTKTLATSIGATVPVRASH